MGGSTFDHGSYLVPRGTADIFFPTDFALLGALYRQAAQRAQRAQHASSGSSSEGATRSDSATSGSHAGGAAGSTPAVRAEALGTADFMARYSPDLAATRTASGYNPLLEDYSNSAFFLGSCLWQRAFFVGGSAA